MHHSEQITILFYPPQQDYIVCYGRPM